MGALQVPAQANQSRFLGVRGWHPPARKPAYLTAIVLGGATVTLISLYDLSARTPSWPLLIVLALTMLSGTATLRLPSITASFSISDTFTIAAALLFGPAAGVVAVVLDSLVISFRLAKRNLGIQRLVFNTAAPALAMWLAARCFVGLIGVSALIQSPVPLARWFGPLVLFTALYFVLNSGFVAGAVALTERKPLWAIWRRHFLPLWLTHFGGAAVTALLIALVQSRGADLYVLALVAPIPFILYATFKSVVGRIEDQLEHFGHVNRMHLATIETLAHAIDAKDQVTHGHIRRVQQQAVRLAAALGIEEGELQAIHAAALLHDLGKLAIPEHILNKPGKLTPAEFEKMKEHASIGAEILSSIDFPYAVEPIVRYHHENWDGTGYPAGLKGEHIPIGARILQVVDCFDALTSDRPYRPRMTSAHAMAIVRNRAGTMYDPRVVAKFVEIRPGETSEADATPISPALSAIIETVHSDAARRLSTAAATSIDACMLGAMYDLAGAIARNPSVVADRLQTALAQIMPATCSAIFVYDPAADSLVARYVSRQYARQIEGLVIPLGQRLSGWVAAQRSTIVNSDPALDLGSVVMQLDPPPRSCLSTALCVGEQLVGALTVYSAADEAFANSHVDLIQLLAPRIAEAVQEASSSHVENPQRETLPREFRSQRPAIELVSQARRR